MRRFNIFFFRILGNFLRRIGCQPVTNFPNGIDISDAGDILVGDSHGNQFHVAVYDRRGDLVSQFQCPQVIKVYQTSKHTFNLIKWTDRKDNLGLD
jgi:hypothetical protein